MSLETARKIADAVLYEGYILYPYRASHGKNSPGVRWQFGVLVPQRHSTASPLPAGAESAGPTVSGAGETWFSQTECIVDPRGEAAVEVRMRFLHLQSRLVEAATTEGGFAPVESLDVDGQLMVTWDEGVEHEIDTGFDVAALRAGERIVPVELPGSEEIDTLEDRRGSLVGRVIRRREALSLRLAVSAEELPGPYGIVRLRVRVENVTDWADPAALRAQSVLRGPVATHVILALSPGSSFVSLLEPPEWAKPAVAACANLHTWPVLVGEGSSDTVLSAPMVLPDFPEIAPESPMDLFDGTENDELLSLRIQTLTDEEKAQARATDPRAAAIIDQVDNLPPEIYERLHGAIRSLRQTAITGDTPGPPAGEEIPEIWNDAKTGELARSPITGKAPAPIFDAAVDATYSPDTDSVVVMGVTLSKGSRVYLRPGAVRSDAQDMFLEGRTASVQAVLFDAEDEPYLAVTLDDHPGADIQIAHGRFLYFKPYEVEPLSEEPGDRGVPEEHGARGVAEEEATA